MKKPKNIFRKRLTKYVFCIYNYVSYIQKENIMRVDKIEAVSFRTVFKPYMELVSKKDGMSLTEFINDCIRKELQRRAAFLANEEAVRVTAEEMGIPEIGVLSIQKIESIISKENWEIFHKKWSEHYTNLKKELEIYFGNEGIPDKDGNPAEAPIVLDGAN